MRRISVERIWLDHLLATLCGVMGVYSVAMSVGGTTLPLVLAAGVFLAGIAGYGMSLVVENTVAHKADGWLFAGAAIFGILKVRVINGMLPEEGFPFALIAATMMFVILVAGGLFAWRDSTLLFTTLPSLVLFGLVGTIDTWRPGLFLFCGLILSISLLYARVHQRTMIKWAEEGGADRRYLYRDVWKWVAGPEYAFVAAGTIILLSFLGAPVVQGSLSGVSDVVRLNVGQQVRRSFTPPAPNNGPSADSPIGNGPVNLSDRLVAKVEIPRPMYLRRMIHDSYSIRGWSTSPSYIQTKPYNFKASLEGLGYVRESTSASEIKLKNRELINYKFEAVGSVEKLIPTPGPVVEISSIETDPQETAALSVLFRTVPEVSLLNAVVSVPLEYEVTTRARIPVEVMPESTASVFSRPPNTLPSDLAKQLNRSGRTDYQILYELKTLIASRCRYNTQTPAVPRNRDPVDYFLNDSKEGYCDLFASAFAIEARRLGYPTRYVTGYLMRPSQESDDGTYHILEKHSHSWAEVYFEDYGWLPFDATEGAEDVTPVATSGQSSGFLAKITAWLSDNAAIVTAVVLGLLLAGVYSLLRSRNIVSLSGSDHNKNLRHFVNRFQVSMERVTGSPRRFSQTMREFADIHASSLEPIASDVEFFIPVIEQAMFSAEGIPESQLSELSTRLSELEKRAKVLQKERVRTARRAKRTA